MAKWKILLGDNRETLKTLPAGLVQCVVTSPPYWGLRDYGHAGQMGLETTPQEYVDGMVALFAEVRRVLRDDGTLWLNIGDCYGDKNLLGIPWRVAFALQADGWYLRQEIIWHKPNPMPGSYDDRCTTAHEHIFLLAKSAAYYYDAEAIKEPAKYAGDKRGSRPDSRRGTECNSMSGETGTHRNKRSVWTVPVASEKASHFAAYPPKLIRPCVLAGTSERGRCRVCRAPYVREVEKVRIATRPGTDTKVAGGTMVVGNRDPERHVTHTRTVGWRAGCDCHAGEPVPCVVLDPFAGTGTTLAVAVAAKRDAIGCELNPEYVAIAEKKITKYETASGFGF